jgi:hypothetical protein
MDEMANKLFENDRMTLFSSTIVKKMNKLFGDN